MRTAAALFGAVMALAVVAGQARGFNDGMLLFSNEVDGTMPQSLSAQRTLKQAVAATPGYSPAVCPNADIPSQIVARVAILQFARPGGSTDANYGVRLYVRALYNIYRNLNRIFGTNLKYSVKNYGNPGVVTNPAQPGKSTQGWFFYYIVLDLGPCGVYKADFLRALRNIIRKPRPGGSQIKRLRVINY